MKTLFRQILTLTAITIIISCSGQSAVYKQSLTFVTPSEAEVYIKEKEKQYTDIRPGLEKTIIWANTDKSQTEYAYIYLHGFTASRGEIAPVVTQAAEKNGFNIFYTRLRGHGRTREAYKGVSAKDWLADCYEAFDIGKAIGKKVIIVATSTGAPLSMRLIEANPIELAGIVWVSPNFEPANKQAELLLSPFGYALARFTVGKYRTYSNS